MILASRGIKKRFRIQDFVLEFGEAKDLGPQKSWQEMKMIAQMIAHTFTEDNDPKKRKR